MDYPRRTTSVGLLGSIGQHGGYALLGTPLADNRPLICSVLALNPLSLSVLMQITEQIRGWAKGESKYL